MSDRTIEETLRELERRIAAASVPEKRRATPRLRHLVAVTDPGRSHVIPMPDEDPLFDNVPV